MGDRNFWRELAARTEHVQEQATGSDADIMFLQCETRDDLRQLAPLQRHIKRNGAIWVVRPKGLGKDAAITEGDVMNLAKTYGLVDVKVVNFSPTHTAEKLVIPLRLR